MISTHKMLAARGEENKAQIIDQASTLSTNTRTFFDCSETSPVTVATDVVKGSTLTDDGATNVMIVEDGAIDGVTVRIMVDPGGVMGVAAFDDPGESDYIIIACARSVAAGLDTDDNGAVSFYMGSGNVGQMKVQPYYAVFSDSTQLLPVTRSSVATPQSSKYVLRTEGEDYMFAAWKNGDYMYHAGDGETTGSVNVAAHYDGYLADKWRNQTGKAAAVRIGHSAYAYISSCSSSLIDSNICEIEGEPVPGVFSEPIPPNTDVIVNKEQDFYGLLVHFFPNGAPSQAEIERGMAWMKERWLQGYKVIYPGWMF